MSVHEVVVTGIHYSSITCQNVLHFYNPDGVLTEAQIASDVHLNYCTVLAAGQTSQFGWRSISSRKMGSGLAPYVFPFVLNGADLSDASLAVPAVCVKFRLLTPTAGRRGRGRIYVPGFRQAYWNAGQITSTGITNITPRINAIKAAYVNAGHTSYLSLVVIRRGGSEADMHFVSDIVLSNTPGIQRRRNLLVGI